MREVAQMEWSFPTSLQLLVLSIIEWGGKQLLDDSLLVEMPFQSWSVAPDLYTGEAANLDIDGENSSNRRRREGGLSDHRFYSRCTRSTVPVILASAQAKGSEETQNGITKAGWACFSPQTSKRYPQQAETRFNMLKASDNQPGLMSNTTSGQPIGLEDPLGASGRAVIIPS
jgi:hypothetical protein